MRQENFEISEEQLDAFKEIVSIGVGKAASLLNKILKKHISLQIPNIKIYNSDQNILNSEPIRPDIVLNAIHIDFRGDANGKAFLILSKENALRLITLLVGETDTGEDFSAIKEGALVEIGNILLNAVVGSFSNVLKMRYSYSIPVFSEGSFEQIFRKKKNQLLILVQTEFNVHEQQIKGDIGLMFSIDAFQKLIKEIEIYIQTAYD